MNLQRATVAILFRVASALVVKILLADSFPHCLLISVYRIAPIIGHVFLHAEGLNRAVLMTLGGWGECVGLDRRCHQTLNGSSSPVSKPIFASKNSFRIFRILRDLQVLHTRAPLFKKTFPSSCKKRAPRDGSSPTPWGSAL